MKQLKKCKNLHFFDINDRYGDDMNVFNFDNNSSLQNLIIKQLNSSYDFNYFSQLLKENNFFEYYAKLPKKDKFNIIFYLQMVKDNDKFEQSNYDFYSEIEKWQNNLISRLDGKISTSELEFVINLLADRIVNNEKVDKNLIIKLSENYILISPLIIPEELPILLLYNLYLINQFTDSNYTVSFKTNEYAFACTNYSDSPETLFINSEFYYQVLKSEQITKQDYLNLFCFQTFALLHEAKHLKQFEYMDTHNDDYAKAIGLDLGVATYDYDFYRKNHDMFLIESEANSFGRENLERFCHNLLSHDYIQKFIELSKSTLSKLSKEEFRDKYNEICSKIIESISEAEKKLNF